VFLVAALAKADESRVRVFECETASNHDPIRMLCMPLINQANRLAGMGSRFARKMTPAIFHLVIQNQWVGWL
jgi:hypothetical protein